jgi:hypothetical protein
MEGLAAMLKLITVGLFMASFPAIALAMGLGYLTYTAFFLLLLLLVVAMPSIFLMLRPKHDLS